MGTVSTRPRIDLTTAAPDGYHALVAFSQAAGGPLDPGLVALVQLRVSQVNGCGYCTAVHAEEARMAGISVEALPEWRTADAFSAAQRAALDLAEAVTLIGDGGVPDPVWDEAARYYTPEELACLLWTTAAVNAWNRAAIATRLQP